MKNLRILMVGLFLAACSPSSDNKYYDTLSKSQWSKTKIEVIWMPSLEAANEKCTKLSAKVDPFSGGAFAACARSKPDDISVCEIYTVEPESFDDNVRLANLGHEVWHCLGAKHN